MCDINSVRLQVAQVEWSKIFDQQQNHKRREEFRTRDPVFKHCGNKTNDKWGDEMEEKERGVLRIYSQNVNGFTLDRRGGQFGDLCKVLQEVQADVYCGQEHNLDVLKPQVKSILFEPHDSTGNDHA